MRRCAIIEKRGRPNNGDSDDERMQTRCPRSRSPQGVMVADRSAVSTIAGYFYQFDRSIISIPGLSGANDSVAIESIVETGSGRASGRERVGKYVEEEVVDV